MSWAPDHYQGEVPFFTTPPMDEQKEHFLEHEPSVMALLPLGTLQA